MKIGCLQFCYMCYNINRDATAKRLARDFYQNKITARARGGYFFVSFLNILSITIRITANMIKYSINITTFLP